MKYLKTFFAVLLASACLGVGAEFIVLLDFGDADTDPAGSEWNAGIRGDTGRSNLTDTDGNSTGINVSMTNADDFTSNERWDDSNHVNPPWVDPATTDGANVLSDRVSWDRNTEGTVVFSGLQAGWTYDFEIASGLAQNGDTGSTGLGRDPNEFEMVGGNGLVAGHNPHRDANLGTTVTWYPNPAGTSNDDISVGWIRWSGVTANQDGEITLTVRGLSGTNSRGTINAMQITAIPEPGTLALIFLGGLLVYFRRRRS